MELVILVFLYTLCTGGKVRRLLSCPVKMEWLLVIYVALQVVVRLPVVVQGLRFRDHSLLMLCLYFLLILILWFNRHLSGAPWMIAGASLNGLVLALNGGRMPVHAGALKWAGQHELWRILSFEQCTTHVLMSEGTKLFFLGDVIPTPSWWFYPRVLSVGDVILVIGLCIFMVRGLKYGCEDTTN